MKEEILKDFRKEYTKRLEEYDENHKSLEVLINRKNILENSPLIKSYIELCSQIEDAEEKMLTYDEVFSETFYEFYNNGLFSETNNIYMYVGSFINENGYERQVERNDLLGEFDRYIDIESFETIEIPVEDRSDFENRYSVIAIENEIPNKYLLYEIREQFINDALLNGQEIACKKILSRNKKN